ncbi:MAG: preprotein translocase subunit YajC [Oligoflexia bacterium]|nr:preprotein translocase subunit YajC [Oligoflexia bacterium]
MSISSLKKLIFSLSLSFIPFSLFASAPSSSSSSPSTASAAQQQPSMMMSLLPFVLIFMIFYFLMIRPQKKRMQQEENMLATLQKGEEIYTKSGVIGVISAINDTIVTMEISEGVHIKVLRSQIGGLSKKLFEDKSVKQDKKGK